MHFTRFFQTRSFFVFILIVAFLFEALLISYRNEETILQAASSDEALFLYDSLCGYGKFIDTLDPKIFPNGFLVLQLHIQSFFSMALSGDDLVSLSPS